MSRMGGWQCGAAPGSNRYYFGYGDLCGANVVLRKTNVCNPVKRNSLVRHLVPNMRIFSHCIGIVPKGFCR